MRCQESDLAAFTSRTLEQIGARHGLKAATVKKSLTVPKPSKYKNVKVKTLDGTFDSRAEFRRWEQLKLLQSLGKISGLNRQVPFILAPSVVIDGRKRPPLKFTADFSYVENGETIVEDTKSPATAAETAFKIRRHLLKSVLGIDLRVTG